MKLRDIIILLIVLVIVISVIIFSEIQSYTRPVPITVFVWVLDVDGNPEINAFCRADIITENGVVEDKPLEEVGSIFDYISPGELSGLEEKGYYKLETGLTKQDKTFEIKIVCINPGATGVSYTILNNTHLPCEIQEGGYWIC